MKLIGYIKCKQCKERYTTERQFVNDPKGGAIHDPQWQLKMLLQEEHKHRCADSSITGFAELVGYEFVEDEKK